MAIAFPFSAIVGQDEMKLAILIAAIDPRVGGRAGVWRSGHRQDRPRCVRWPRMLPPMKCGGRLPLPLRPGCCATGCLKTASARKLKGKGKTALKSHTRAGCRWSTCRWARPKTVWSVRSTWSGRWREGVKAFEPGLLARANRGFLYIDEVNLLEDHLVDLLIGRGRLG